MSSSLASSSSTTRAGGGGAAGGSTHQGSGSSQSSKKEYLVRIPKTQNRRLSILKFNESLNVRPQQWPLETLRMEREDNRREGVNISGEILQDFGEGSEYGKAAREELRRKKYGRQTRKYQHDNQPWRLSIEQNVVVPSDGTKKEEGGGGGGKKVRKFRSIREAGATEHADWWVFYKVGNDLEAYKVDEWYQFLPAVTYKYLDAEQAEERFKERDKVFNQFALKAQIQKQLAEQEERKLQENTLAKGTSSLKIKDEASDDEEDEGGDMSRGGDEAAEAKNAAKSKKKNGGPSLQRGKAEKKKQRVENADEVAAYESEDGEDEGREYDYMSDSGSDTDREELNVEKKMDEDLVGVAEESGLKKSLESDEELAEGEQSEEEEEMDEEEEKGASAEEENRDGEGMAVDKEASNQGSGMAGEEAEIRKFADRDVRSSKAIRNVEKIMAQKPGVAAAKIFQDEDEFSGASDSDEDPDSDKVKSVLFMQDKRKKPSSAQLQQQQPPTSTAASGGANGAAAGSTSGAGSASTTAQQRKRIAADEGANAADQSNASSAGTSKKGAGSDVKRQKLSESADEKEPAISETFIRKLLEKKPHSTKQLLAKVNLRLQQQQHGGGGDSVPSSSDASGTNRPTKDKRIVTQLADILKKIGPYQFKKTNEAGKDILYFSMNRTTL